MTNPDPAVFYYPAFVRIEARDLEHANELADEHFADVKPGSPAERAGEQDGFYVSDEITVGWLGKPKQEDE